MVEGIGVAGSNVDIELYLLFSKPGQVEAPPRLAAWAMSTGRIRTTPFVDRISVVDETDLDSILGPESD